MVDVLVKAVLVELTILKPISIFEFLRYCWPSWISNDILATVSDSSLGSQRCDQQILFPTLVTNINVVRLTTLCKPILLLGLICTP